MFIVLLKFSENKDQAGQYMDGHNQWLKQGFEDGVFLLPGSLQPEPGGGILAHAITLSDLERRVNEDPFMKENVVSAEIMEISPAKTDVRLQFLINQDNG